ncbi:copper transporter [Pseudosporangium ferrugineum]|uniref:Copper transport outer membrane protein MctB n=1 Tax=Pseudosporangium ferrugineum TaxID=439699 RepID=A0A2T0REI7_9ACTN|nr:copper transporter [Pseudosporangium ferrugineum]PRY19573.1 copper transport outer membrane protein MctB [Pseudosporangium ferrugineum]
MINFRYHVVSLTAVFLALAIGLVVGTAALNGPVVDTLKDRVDALSKDNSNYREQASQYRDELNRGQDFATQVSPGLLNGKLTGRKLVVVVLPSGKDYADGVTSMLEVAGATITGRVTLQDKFFDPPNALELLGLAERAARPTVSAEGLPLNSDGVETSSALLALALLQKVPAVDEQDLTAVLTAYTEPGYLQVSDDVVPGAEAAVVVSGLPPVDRDAAKKNQNAVTVVAQFSRNKPVIVAGNGIGEGNLVSEVRGDPTLVSKVSTVDNVSTTQGQLATALTVVERVVAAKVGQYGLSGSSLVPKTAG